ncbi:MAG TPA: cytochrome c-type biogenesis protein CcmH [Thermoleophilaceae bacterium]
MRRLAALMLVLALLAPGAALAAQPRASLADIEDEVMCQVCGTPLNVSDSLQAQRERAFIVRLIDQGKTKQQIKDALVAQYGDSVLAVPKKSGFDLTAYLVPILVFLGAAAVIALAVTRWRRAKAASAAAQDPTSTPPGDQRLRADLERYDL